MSTAFFPRSLAVAIADAVASASAGSKGLAGCLAFRSAVGNGYQLRLYLDGDLKVTLSFADQMPVVNNRIEMPASPSISGLSAADIATGVWTAQIGSASAYVVTDVGPAGSGAAVKLSGSLDPAKGLRITSLILQFDPALDPVPGPGSVPPGATVLWSGSMVVPNNWLGVHTHAEDPTPTATYKAIRSLDNDVMYMRFWCPTSSTYYWNDVDTWVDYHYGAGHAMNFVPGATPAWAAVSGSAANPKWPGWPGGLQPWADLAVFKARVKALLQRAKDRGKPFRFVEGFNEPSWGSNGTGSPTSDSFWQGTPAQLAAHQRVLYQAAKEVDPSIIVLSPGFVYLNGCISSFLNASDGAGGYGRQWIDAMAFHFYDGYARPSEGASIASKLSIVRAEMALGGLSTSVPIYDSEHGFGGYDGNNRFRDASPSQKQNLLYGAGLMAMVQDIKGTFYYDIGGSTIYLGWNTASAQIAAALAQLSAVCGKTLSTVYIDASGNYGCLAS